MLTAQHHDYDDNILREKCKQQLSYRDPESDDVSLHCDDKEHMGDDIGDDISLPVYNALKKYTIKGPTKGYYFTSLALWLVLFLRVSDAMTDWSVTFNYYFNWDQVVHESLANLGTLNMSFENTDQFKQVNIYSIGRWDLATGGPCLMQTSLLQSFKTLAIMQLLSNFLFHSSYAKMTMNGKRGLLALFQILDH